MFLSTRGDPRNAIRDGQNFCHRNVVKCLLVWVCCGRLEIRVWRHSNKKTTPLQERPVGALKITLARINSSVEEKLPLNFFHSAAYKLEYWNDFIKTGNSRRWYADI
jgi:hypothetical protein